MEISINLRIRNLPEAVYLATSDEVPGLVAQGRTIYEALEIPRDVAKKIVEARKERNEPLPLSKAENIAHYQIVVGA